MLNPFYLKPGEEGMTTRQSRRAWEDGTTTQELHACHVSFKCESPGAPASFRCVVPFLINAHPIAVKIFLPPRHLSKTLAPPLALDDAGDEALSCRDFSDAVLTPAADIVLSAVAVGVLRRQVRARWAELLGLLFIPSSSSSCGNYNSIFTTFLIFKIHPVYQK